MPKLLGWALFAVAAAACAAAQTPQQLADQALTQKNVGCSNVQDEQQCHSTYVAGCGRTASSPYDAYLDFFKNQLSPAASTPAETVDRNKLKSLEAGTPSNLVEGNHKDFSAKFVQLKEGEIVDAVGYLYYAESTGKESSNCYLDGAPNVDIHIGVGFDASLATQAKAKPQPKTPAFVKLQANSMIVEMTPHYRAKFEPNWSVGKLQAAYGMQVHVVGQLIADNDHHTTADDCSLQGAASTCWRLSIWEIHPVTAFYVCTASGGCPNAQSPGWTKLEDWTGSSSSGKPHRPKHPTHSPPA